MKRLLYRVYTLLKEHSESCQFFDEFGILVQTLLGIICLSALILKRFMEDPRRSWTVWFFDTLKQVVGQSTQHISNLLIAERIGQGTGLECEWYLNNLIADCSVGVLFCYLYLQLLLTILEGTKYEFTSGNYGQDAEQKGWKLSLLLYQILWWILVVTLSKFTTTGLLFIMYRVVEQLGKFLLTPFKNDSKLKLICVMIIFPTLLNMMQFWFTDNFIKNPKVYPEKEYKAIQTFANSSTSATDNYDKEKDITEYKSLPLSDQNS